MQSTTKTSTPNASPNRSTQIWLGLTALILIVSAILFYRSRSRPVPVNRPQQFDGHVVSINAEGKLEFAKVFEEVCLSESMSSENNGFRLIVQQIDLSAELNQAGFEQVCRKLGLDPSECKPSLQYIDPYQHLSQYSKSKDFDVNLVRRLDHVQNQLTAEELAKKTYEEFAVTELLHARSGIPWNAEDLPMLQTWVVENSPVLNLFGEAVRKNTFEVPFYRGDDSKSLHEFTNFHFQLFRSIARGYASRANYYLGNGEVRKAIDDFISCKRLGRLTRNDPTVFGRFVGIAIESISHSIGFVNPRNDTTTKEDLEYLVKELETIPKSANMDRAFLHAKWAEMEVLQNGPELELTEEMPGVDQAKRLIQLGLDWNLVLKEFSSVFDSQRNEGSSIPETLELTSQDQLSIAARSEKFARWYRNQVFFLDSTIEAENRLRCSDQLLSIVLAMLRYEKDHGTLPPAYTADGSGKPVHSWRILLLPYLGEQKLYEKIRLDEPWHSPHNAALENECPSIFRCPSCLDCADNQTSYSIVLGPELPFSGNRGQQLKKWGPDSDDMILVVERTQPTHWMDPMREISQEEAEKGVNDPSDTETFEVGSSHNSGVQFGLRNGTAIFYTCQLEHEILMQLLRGTCQKIQH